MWNIHGNNDNENNDNGNNKRQAIMLIDNIFASVLFCTIFCGKNIDSKNEALNDYLENSYLPIQKWYILWSCPLLEIMSPLTYIAPGHFHQYHQ